MMIIMREQNVDPLLLLSDKLSVFHVKPVFVGGYRHLIPLSFIADGAKGQKRQLLWGIRQAFVLQWTVQGPSMNCTWSYNGTGILQAVFTFSTSLIS